MGSLHVYTLSPFGLDQVPGILSGPIGVYAKASSIHTVEHNVSTGELIMKVPLVKCWDCGVDWCGSCSIILGLLLHSRDLNLPISISQQSFGCKELGHGSGPFE